MAVTVTVNMKFETYDQKTSRENFERGRLALANQALMDSEAFVPMRSGTLRATGHVVGSGEALRWQTVYARAHFFGTNGIVTFRKYTTPGTGQKWTLKAKKAHIDKWKQTAVKVMRL